MLVHFFQVGIIEIIKIFILQPLVLVEVFLRDLSHEIDILLWIFGPVKEIVSLGGHFSNLYGDSEDIFKLIFKMNNSGVASLSLDYLNRLQKRNYSNFRK